MFWNDFLTKVRINEVLSFASCIVYCAALMKLFSTMATGINLENQNANELLVTLALTCILAKHKSL